MKEIFSSTGLLPKFSFEEAKKISEELNKISCLDVHQSSITVKDGIIFFLGKKNTDKYLGIAATEKNKNFLNEFSGDFQDRLCFNEKVQLKISELRYTNMLILQNFLPFLTPKIIGFNKSFGFGDRLGCATPGHIKAVCNSDFKPFFIQQSKREMDRTLRTPEQVMNDGLWNIFQEGYREDFGADADHLKNTDDIDLCIKAGFTLFTFDPGDYVEDPIEEEEILKEKIRNLDWDVLKTKNLDWMNTYVDKTFYLIDGSTLTFSYEDYLEAVVKYGKVIAATVLIYQHLKNKFGKNIFEFEISIDETLLPTTPKEHFFIAKELLRLGVFFISLAPRFVGRFEKGVDYIGNISNFKKTFAQHIAIAKTLGPYKLSLHSGSDKFSIYPIIGKLGEDYIHIKTAGTSYLEALRTIAQIDSSFFKEILSFAKIRYNHDKLTYHVSAKSEKLSTINLRKDLISLLDDFDARQILHVTFGSVLNNEKLKTNLLKILKENEELYTMNLQKHLGKHLELLKQ